jgi:hypothetical protein
MFFCFFLCFPVLTNIKKLIILTKIFTTQKIVKMENKPPEQFLDSISEKQTYFEILQITSFVNFSLNIRCCT